MTRAGRVSGALALVLAALTLVLGDPGAARASTVGGGGDGIGASHDGAGAAASSLASTPFMPAVLALERLNCNTINATGQGGLKVSKTGTSGGWIHSDTAAVPGATIGTATSNCASPAATTCSSFSANSYSLLGTALPSGAGGGPAIVAEDNGTAAGTIGVAAQVPGVGGAIGCTYPTGINVPTTGEDVISRAPVDARYDAAANPFGDNIATRHARGFSYTTGFVPFGYTVIGDGGSGGACNTNNVLYVSAKVYVNCPSGFTAHNVLFTGTDIVFAGTVATSGGFLAFPHAREIDIRGCNGCNTGIGLSVTGGGRLSVNSGMDQCDAAQHAMNGGALACGSPYITSTWANQQPASGTLVPGMVTNGVTDGYAIPTSGANSAWPYVECLAQANGPGSNFGWYDNQTLLTTFGGSVNVQTGELNLCQTSLYVGANSASYTKQSIVTGNNCSPALPCPTNNANILQINLNPGSKAPVQWTAPVHNIKGPDALSPFDDLALWTEASGASCSIAGQGMPALAGVFFAPNCNLSYGAQSSSNVPVGAQLIVRTLTMAGQGILYLKPNPNQSILTPLSDIAWSASVDGAGSELPRATAVDAGGNTYVVGTFDQTATFGSGAAQQVIASSGATDAFVAKHDASGALVWVQRLGGAGADEGWGLALDASGDPVVTGIFTGSVGVGAGASTQTIDGVDDMFVASFSPTGELRWVDTGGGAGIDKGLDVSIDGSGTVYVGGVLSSAPATFGPNALSTTGGFDGFVAAYASDGTPQWVRDVGGGATNIVKTVAGLPAGGVVAAGWFDGTLTADTTATQLTSNGDVDGFALRLDAAGQASWLRDIGGASVDLVWGSAADASGNVYLSGAFTGSASVGGLPNGALNAATASTDGFVTRLDSAGAPTWADSFGGPGIDLALGVAVTGTQVDVATAVMGEAWFGATSRISAGGFDGVVARIDAPTGTFGALTQIASGPGNDFAVDVAPGAWGSVVATGNFQGTIVLGEPYAQPQLTATGGDDLYVAKIKP